MSGNKLDESIMQVLSPKESEASFSTTISSNTSLARCRELMKKHENVVIPETSSYFAFGMPAIYEIRWRSEMKFSIVYWYYHAGRGGAGYREGLEVIGRVEGNSTSPIFVLTPLLNKFVRNVFLMLLLIAGIELGITVCDFLNHKATDRMFFISALIFAVLAVTVSSIFYVIEFFSCSSFLKKLLNSE